MKERSLGNNVEFLLVLRIVFVEILSRISGTDKEKNTPKIYPSTNSMLSFFKSRLIQKNYESRSNLYEI